MNNNYSNKITTMACLVFCTLSAAAQNQPIPVIVAPVDQQNISNPVEALGTLHAIESINLTAQVTDFIANIKFSDGQRVRQGDVLIELDSSDEQALLTEEKARLHEAKRQVDRLKPLALKNATSESVLDAQNSLVSISQAKIDGIQAAINKRTLKAPFDGVMGLSSISPGTLAQPGMQLATLDKDDVMKLDFTIPTQYLAHLKPGLDIKAYTTAYPNKTFIGTLATIDSRIDTVTRSVAVRALLDNPGFILKPGLLMRINLKTQPRQAITVPEEALTSDGDIHFVYVIDASQTPKTVRKQVIKMGTRPSGRIEVLAGLEVGQQVVIHGTSRIHDQSPVTITAVKKADESLTELLKQQQTP